MYLLELFFVRVLQPLLSFVELPDPIFAELIILEQQVVQALEIEVLGLLSVAHISEYSHLFRL